MNDAMTLLIKIILIYIHSLPSFVLTPIAAGPQTSQEFDTHLEE